jgi:hypothetical protein
MLRIAVKCLMIGSICIGSNTSGWGLDGKQEFLSNCAGCHGVDGKGKGPLSKTFTSKPADLTTVAKRNNGVFSKTAVSEMIDGRKSPRSHRLSDMPIWGCRHGLPPDKRKKAPKPDALDALLDLPCPPEADIRNRIQSIVDYLSQIQMK